MKNKSIGKSRRNLLKSIAAGSGVIVAGKSLPENWTKPVVDSVMLPAHAITSQLTYSCEITGLTSLFIDSIAIPGPVFYIIENTGTGPLTGGFPQITPNDGTIGGNISFIPALVMLPDPFLPGDIITLQISNIDVTACNPSGAGSITFDYTSNETSCILVVPVTCDIIG
jgi:hypothetical protein